MDVDVVAGPQRDAATDVRLDSRYLYASDLHVAYATTFLHPTFLHFFTPSRLDTSNIHAYIPAQHTSTPLRVHAPSIPSFPHMGIHTCTPTCLHSSMLPYIHVAIHD